MNGILLVDKPSGFTSHDVIAKLRGILRERRIGHAGTLDPMATGLLVVLVGRATRAASFAEAENKAYIGALRPGITTDTLDISGEILTESNGVEISEDDVKNILPRFTGDIEQLPPMYSAKKVGGKKLYELARKGVEIERKMIAVNISSLELLGRDGGDFILRCHCSKGTYIRTLFADIGAALGCGAALSALRRISSGDFDVADAHTLEDITNASGRGEAQSLFLPVDRLFMNCEPVSVTDHEEFRCRSGAEFETGLPSGIYRLYGAGGAFLALSESNGKTMRTIKSFYEV